MSSIIISILSISSKELIKLLTATISAVSSFFCYKNNKQQLKKDEKQQKKNEKYCKKVDDVVDNGTIDDLLDLRR